MTLEIMMPFYGSFEHFRLAVESVLAQDDPDWRLTIVDDAYPDAAPGEWAKAIDDDRVTYLRNDQNLRPSRNYNKCVSLTREEFVVMMGCDDVMLPGYVSRVRELIDSFPDADVIQPGVEVIDAEDELARPLADRVKSWYRFRGAGARELRGEELAVSLVRGNWTYFPSLTWRAERLRVSGFRADLDIVQDLSMLVDIGLAGGSLVLDDDVVFRYRRHRRSASAIAGLDGSRFAQEATLFAECRESFRRVGWTRAARAARRHLSSRLNALSELPRVLLSGNRTGTAALVRHVLGRPPARSDAGQAAR
jgi:glycosyltransferase involved in cell wall biosynthesis